MSSPAARQVIRRINQAGGLSRSPNSQRTSGQSVQAVCRNTTSAGASTSAPRTMSKVLLAGTGVVAATLAYGLTHPKVAKMAVVEGKVQTIVQRVDELYDSNKLRDALVYLEQYCESNEAEVLWRLSRLCYKVGKYHSSGSEESKQLAFRGLEFAEKAVAADPTNFACHKWLGILINYSSEFEGYKRKIERAFEVKASFEKAIELNPTDAMCKYCMGQWCYGVSDVPWYQRKVATVIFAKPPESDFEEALHYFQAAEEFEPGFYSSNWLYIGKSLLQLGQVEEAGEWLRKAANHQSDVGDDIEARKDAIALLKRLGLSLT